MENLTLIIGNRNYSSWSMRAWLALRQTGVPFREEQIWFDEDENRGRRLSHSPAGKVPVLRHGSLIVWDSLAIGEYLAELCPDAGLWPSGRSERARARSLCAEMHSGFFEIRGRMPMNCRARSGERNWEPRVTREIDRIRTAWVETRQTFGSGGPFLFGEFTLADAFFAPVASRFRTYGVALAGEAAAYAGALLEFPSVREWTERAVDEGHPQRVYDAMLEAD